MLGLLVLRVCLPILSKHACHEFLDLGQLLCMLRLLRLRHISCLFAQDPVKIVCTPSCRHSSHETWATGTFSGGIRPERCEAPSTIRPFALQRFLVKALQRWCFRGRKCVCLGSRWRRYCCLVCTRHQTPCVVHLVGWNGVRRLGKPAIGSRWLYCGACQMVIDLWRRLFRDTRVCWGHVFISEVVGRHRWENPAFVDVRPLSLLGRGHRDLKWNSKEHKKTTLIEEKARELIVKGSMYEDGEESNCSTITKIGRRGLRSLRVLHLDSLDRDGESG